LPRIAPASKPARLCGDGRGTRHRRRGRALGIEPRGDSAVSWAGRALSWDGPRRSFVGICRQRPRGSSGVRGDQSACRLAARGRLCRESLRRHSSTCPPGQALTNPLISLRWRRGSQGRPATSGSRWNSLEALRRCWHRAAVARSTRAQRGLVRLGPR
jgi:hypothetical protein